jgi:sulfite oxidase
MSRYGKRAELIVHEQEPFNAETGLSALAEGPVTATDAFYVRGHGAVPEIDPGAWRLHVLGVVERELRLSLATLREAFREREVTATLQCAGNRRKGLVAIRDIPGEAPWGPGATGTATWTGVALSDVLAAAGPLRAATDVGFDGADLCPEAKPPQRFAGSIPIDKACRREVLLAWAMNGEPLPARARRAAAGGRAGLHRRAQRQVARAGRGPLPAHTRLLPACRLPPAPGGRVAGTGGGHAAGPGGAQLRRAVPG